MNINSLKPFEEAVNKYCEIFYDYSDKDEKAKEILKECYENEDFWDDRIFEDTDFSLNKEKFINIMNCIDEFLLSDDGICVYSKNQYYFNIDFFNLMYSYDKNLNEIDYETSYFNSHLIFAQKFESSGNKIKVGINCDDLTIFEFVLQRDSYFNIYWHSMHKLVVESEKEIDIKEAKRIANAYIFNLMIHDNYSINYAIPPILDYPEVYDSMFTSKYHKHNLKLDVGLEKPISYFIKSKNEETFDIKLVYLFKILEYIGPYVIKENLIKSVDSKLKLLKDNVDINYIMELGDIYYSNNPKANSTKMIKTILSNCIEYDDIKIPKFIKKSGDESINYISKSIVSTRNKIVHSKSNYKDTGFECPDDLNDRLEFINMVERICVESISYYSRIESSILQGKSYE